jgi:mono/diheme cytochrome c family protein
MRLNIVVVGAVLGLGLAPAAFAAQGEAPPDIETLFATVCGWCHNDGGRVAGHGPQLMGTTRSDDYISERIMLGKQGAMPAFAGVLDADEVDRIIAYIRALKPRQE